MLTKRTLTIKFCKDFWRDPDLTLILALNEAAGTDSWIPEEKGDEKTGPECTLSVSKVDSELKDLLSNSFNVWEWHVTSSESSRTPTAESIECHIDYSWCPYCASESITSFEIRGDMGQDYEVGCIYLGYECDECGKRFALVQRPIGIIPLDDTGRWQGSEGFVSRGKIKSDQVIHPTKEML